MNRLSDNAIAIVNELHTERLSYDSEYVPIIDALNRLAEYEDIELEPEKIVFLKNVVDDAFSDKPEFTEHIRELLRAEKDGQLVILPCKVGDSYFIIRKYCDEHGELPYATEHWGSDCLGCSEACNGEFRIKEERFNDVAQIVTFAKSIGETIFLTEEEAEKALEEE